MCNNICGWNMLYPYNYMTNFGGRVQYNTIDTTQYSPQEAYAMQNIGNPFYQLMSLQSGWMQFNAPCATPAMFAQAGAGFGAVSATDSLNDVDIKMVASNLNNLKTQLDQALTSDKLTANQKNVLRELRREVEKLMDKLESLTILKNSADPATVRSGIMAIKEEYRTLRDSIEQVAEAIQNSLVDGIDYTEDSEDTEETVETEEADNGTASGEVLDGIGEICTTTFAEDMYAANVEDDAVITVVNDLYKKIDGSISGGTNHSIKKYIQENINKDNVVEVMLHWNKHYSEIYKEDDPLGFTESIMDDYLAGGKQAVKPVITALKERLAEYNGIDKDRYGIAQTQLAIAENEANCWWANEDKISAAVNKAHAAIVELMMIKAQQSAE